MYLKAYPLVVRQFWGHIRDGVAPGEAGVAVGVPGTTADASGQFTFTGVAPGRYRLTALVPGGSAAFPSWIVKSSILRTSLKSLV